jgi:hypothetical protein
MHSQSDYGYEIGGTEYRDRKVCLERRALCLRLANQYAGTEHEKVFLQHANEWEREAETYP